MIHQPMDVLDQFPIRKSGKQRRLFRENVVAYLESLGYTCTVEKGSLGARNIIAGDPESAKHLITAHYDTCAAMIVPNFITPCNIWLYGLSQIVLTLLILIPAVAVCLLSLWISGQHYIGEICFFVCMFLTLALMMYGPANKNNANDNTSGVITLLEIAKSFPRKDRNQVCFVLFDLEEAGLIGSSSYYGLHKSQCKQQMVWNLDCVGDGNQIIFFPSRKTKKCTEKMALLDKCECDTPQKTVRIHKKGFAFYPSDQMNFPYGVGIATLKTGKIGLYLDRIHTKKDTVLDQTNVNILRAAIISAIACDGV